MRLLARDRDTPSVSAWTSREATAPVGSQGGRIISRKGRMVRVGGNHWARWETRHSGPPTCDNKIPFSMPDKALRDRAPVEGAQERDDVPASRPGESSGS